MEEVQISIAEVCPFTGLTLHGQHTLAPQADGLYLYEFKPIGKAIVDVESFVPFSIQVEGGYEPPLTALAGICREAAELGKDLPFINPQMYTGMDLGTPKTIKEKRLHLLRLLYQAGGEDHIKRDIIIHEDFPLAFADDSHQFHLILESLIDEELLRYDKPDDTPNDWVGGIRTYYCGVLFTAAGMKRVATEVGPSFTLSPPPPPLPAPTTLAHLHPLVHKAAGSLFASGHYPQALLNACTALDKALQQQTGQPADVTGSALMTKVFSPSNPLIRISAVQGEQQGYMFLFSGLVMAIRNHYAHNLTELNSMERALEWLGFVSALCYQVQWTSAGAGGSEPAI